MTGMADGTAYNTQGGIDLETILLHELDHASGGYAEPGGQVMDVLKTGSRHTPGRRYHWYTATVFL